MDAGEPLDLRLMSKVPHYVIKDVLKEEVITIIDGFKFLDFTELKHRVPKECLEVIKEMMTEKALQ